MATVSGVQSVLPDTCQGTTLLLIIPKAHGMVLKGQLKKVCEYQGLLVSFRMRTVTDNSVIFVPS